MSARLIGLAALVLLGADASAQVRAPSIRRAPVSAPTTNGTAVASAPAPGSAVDPSVCAGTQPSVPCWRMAFACASAVAPLDDVVYLVGCGAQDAQGAEVLRLEHAVTADVWSATPLPLRAVRLAVQPNGLLWLVQADGRPVLVTQARSAQPIATYLAFRGIDRPCFREIAVDAAWLLALDCEEQPGGRVVQYLPTGGMDLSQPAPLPHCVVAPNTALRCYNPFRRTTLTAMTVAGRGASIWAAGLAESPTLGRIDPAAGQWQSVAGCAQSLAVTPTTVWAVGCTAQGITLYRRDAQEWTGVASPPARLVASSPGGRLWLVDQAGALYDYVAAP